MLRLLYHSSSKSGNQKIIDLIQVGYWGKWPTLNAGFFDLVLKKASFIAVAIVFIDMALNL